MTIIIGGKKIANDSEPPRDHHPLDLKAKPHSQMPNLQMRATIPQNQKAPIEYVAPQQGITEQKSYASAKRGASKKKQTRPVDEKYALSGGEVKASI